MNELLYKVRGLGKIFNKAGSSVCALGGVNMDIFAGETLGVVGVSGSGKSTLLHILGTLEPPTEGSVFYRGKDLFKQKEKELSVFRNSEIGFIFQFHYLLMEFTALENVMMPCLIDRQSFAVAKQKACEVLEKVGTFRTSQSSSRRAFRGRAAESSDCKINGYGAEGGTRRRTHRES